MSKPAPIRRCAACRRNAPRTEFLRVIRQHDTGNLQFGVGMGRSAYLCPTKACIERIRKKNRLQHVLRTPVSDNVYKCLLSIAETVEDKPEDAVPLAISELIRYSNRPSPTA